MSRLAFAGFLCCIALLLAGCSSGGSNSVQRQLADNQGLIINLQNSPDLANLYLPYDGTTTPGKRTTDPKDSNAAGTGVVQIGELNIMLQNVGGSATAGGLFVSGYDPSLISVCPRIGEPGANFQCLMPGQTPTAEQANARNCYSSIVVNSQTGQYEVVHVCAQADGIVWGGSVGTGANGDPNADVTIGKLPLGGYFDGILSSITGKDVGWFTRNGLFTEGRVDCNIGIRNACSVSFGNPAYNINRALHGYLLLNLLWDEVAKCSNNCWTFPPKFQSGQVMNGVSEAYPVGDALFYNYDIFLNRAAWNPLLNDLPQSFQVTACYLYTATVTPSVCIVPDISVAQNGPCTPSTISFNKQQGAPVIVTSIEQSARPGLAVFTVHIQHIGKGRLWQPGGLDQCGPYSSGRPDRRREDVVQVLDAHISNELFQMDCVPKSDVNGKDITLVRLQNGVGQFTCTYPISLLPGGSRQPYTTSMVLELGFMYQNVIQQDVMIHRT